MAIEKHRQRRRSVYSSLIFLVLLATETAASSWWLLGVSSISEEPVRTNSEPVDCSNVIAPANLTSSQIAGCKEEAVNRVFRSLSVGTRNGIIQCQRSFNRSLWNCTTFNGKNLFGSFINNPTRETAVVNTLLAAGASRAIANDCRQEKLRPGCTCRTDGKPKRDNGTLLIFDCNDDINFANSFLQQYLLNLNASTTDSLAENHNINVGILVSGTKSQSCRCHGISGTCSIQTCYQKGPEIDQIGKIVRNEYTIAIPVKKENDKLVPQTGPATDIPDNVPVFTTPSPNFCTKDLSVGTTGTTDRPCSRNPDHPNNCNLLCCQRGAKVVVEEQYDQCCEFVWCCRLECKPCNHRNVTHYFCN